MKLISKPSVDFQLTEKELIKERRFGLIALLCNKILERQRKCKRDLSVILDDSKTKNGIISFNVWELDRKLGINKSTMELAIVHINKGNELDGIVIKGKVRKFKKSRKI